MHTRQLRRRDGAKSPGAAAAAVASGQRLEVIKVGSLSPWHWAILAVVVIVLFGAKKLPDAARSLGKSLRIFKSEVRELQNENKAEASIETPRRCNRSVSTLSGVWSRQHRGSAGLARASLQCAPPVFSNGSTHVTGAAASILTRRCRWSTT